MHRGVLAADVACRRYPELLDKLTPAGALARMIDERLQREHASPQLREESRLALGPTCQDQQRRGCEYAQRLAAAARAKPCPAPSQGVLGRGRDTLPALIGA